MLSTPLPSPPPTTLSPSPLLSFSSRAAFHSHPSRPVPALSATLRFLSQTSQSVFFTLFPSLSSNETLAMHREPERRTYVYVVGGVARHARDKVTPASNDRALFYPRFPTRGQTRWLKGLFIARSYARYRLRGRGTFCDRCEHRSALSFVPTYSVTCLWKYIMCNPVCSRLLAPTWHSSLQRQLVCWHSTEYVCWNQIGSLTLLRNVQLIKR